MQRRKLRKSDERSSAYRALTQSLSLVASPAAERELHALIGTSSPYPAVKAAVERLFDPVYYMSAHADLQQAKVDPLIHYLTFGWKEDRSASQFFNGAYYKKCNPNLPEDVFPLVHYLETGGGRAKRGNPVSDRFWFTPQAPSEEQWSAVRPARRADDTRLVVIIPVYKGFDETLASIYHALAAQSNTSYSLLVINDKSPDLALTAVLKDLAARGLYDYAENEENLGFVRSVNRALLELSGSHDVVLLNSDAYVFPGWADRLTAHADHYPDAATITPLSNNATICSYPLYVQDNNLALEIAPGALDQLAARVNAGETVEAPTGVGFCFYMRRSVIDEIGPLDTDTFKIGYGEENDFCLRVSQAGYRNLIAGDVFVFHSGSISFSGIKNENYANGLAALNRKHPNYHRTVRNHVEADPEKGLRRNLDRARLIRAMKGCTVFVTHNWSGGIDTYLDHERGLLRQEGRGYIVLRVHDSYFASIETDLVEGLFVPNLTALDLRDDFPFVAELIAGLEPARIHVNSFAGLTWLWHKTLLEFLGGLGSPLTYVGHDYAPVSHYYQLLRPDNVLSRTLPSLDDLRGWSQFRDQSGSLDVCDPEVRQRVYHDFLARADQIQVPSRAARDIYLNYFPKLRINVASHPDHLPETRPAVRRERDGLIIIAVVGAIGTHKGFDVLESQAADARNRKLPIEYHLIGYSKDDEALKVRGVVLHGRFTAEEQAMELLDKISPDLLMIPSIWPETFCYTLSMALKKKIPPVVFDLGAQGERVREIPWGSVLPLDLANRPGALSDTLLALPLDRLWREAAGKGQL